MNLRFKRLLVTNEETAERVTFPTCTAMTPDSFTIVIVKCCRFTIKLIPEGFQFDENKLLDLQWFSENVI